MRSDPPFLSGRNLLDWRPFAALMRSRWYPAVFQWIGASFFALIVWQLLLGPVTAHDNLGTALVWVIWWPLLPLTFIAFGRLWCAVCPFGWLSDAVQRIVGVGRRTPRFLKLYGIWVIDACFILVTWADHVFGIVESPWGSGILLLLTTTAVVASGAFFERRTFCRYLCFLGGVAGNYSRTGMVQLRANADVCATCTSRAACFNGTEHVAGCPMFEFPRKMEESTNCTLCANCIKTCPHGAISISIRPPAKELWFIRTPRIEAAFLAVAIMGIVFVQNITMLGFWGDVESFLVRLTGTSAPAVIYTIVFALAIAIPAGLLYLASRLAGRVNGETVRRNFTLFGYALIPLDVAAHLAHNMFHLLAEGKSVVFTTLALFGRDTGGSASLLGMGAIQVLQYFLIALGVGASAYTAYRIARRHGGANGRTWSTYAPYAAFILVLAVINGILFALPMAHRM